MKSVPVVYLRKKCGLVIEIKVLFAEINAEVVKYKEKVGNSSKPQPTMIVRLEDVWTKFLMSRLPAVWTLILLYLFIRRVKKHYAFTVKKIDM